MEGRGRGVGGRGVGGEGREGEGRHEHDWRGKRVVFD